MALPLFILSNEEKTETDYRAVHFFFLKLYMLIYYLCFSLPLTPIVEFVSFDGYNICQFSCRVCCAF